MILLTARFCGDCLTQPPSWKHQSPRCVYHRRYALSIRLTARRAAEQRAQEHISLCNRQPTQLRRYAPERDVKLLGALLGRCLNHLPVRYIHDWCFQLGDWVKQSPQKRAVRRIILCSRNGKRQFLTEKLSGRRLIWAPFRKYFIIGRFRFNQCC